MSVADTIWQQLQKGRPQGATISDLRGIPGISRRERVLGLAVKEPEQPAEPSEHGTAPPAPPVQAGLAREVNCLRDPDRSKRLQAVRAPEHLRTPAHDFCTDGARGVQIRSLRSKLLPPSCAADLQVRSAVVHVCGVIRSFSDTSLPMCRTP